MAGGKGGQNRPGPVCAGVLGGLLSAHTLATEPRLGLARGMGLSADGGYDGCLLREALKLGEY